MSEFRSFSPKKLKSLKKDELVRLILDFQKNEPTSHKNSPSSDNLDKNLSPNSVATQPQNSISPDQPAFSIGQVKGAVFEAVQQLRSEIRLEYTALIKDLRDDFRQEIDNIRDEMARYRDKIDETLRKTEIEFLKDLQDAESRKDNVMIFGLSESTAPDPDVRKREDMQKILSLTSKIGVSDLQPLKVIRLGRVGNNPRPVKLIGLTSITRSALLTSAPRIRGLNESDGFKNVFVKPDLTPKQQLADRIRREELKTRRNAWHSDCARSDMIVTNFSRYPSSSSQ